MATTEEATSEESLMDMRNIDASEGIERIDFGPTLRPSARQVESRTTAPQSEEVSDNERKAKLLIAELRNGERTFLQQFRCSWMITTFVTFWKNVAKRVWHLYVEALFIPAYRPEWGKYSKWSFRLKPKPELSLPELRKQAALRRKKNLLRYIKAVGGPGIVHNSYDCSLITINISGYRYQTQARTLKRFPETLLGDPDRRLRYFDPVHKEYFFDRHRTSFEAILYFYQSGGVLSRPAGVPFKIFENEIRFFQLGSAVMKKYLDGEGIYVEDPKPFPKNLYLRKLWLLLEYPESSKQARIVSFISISVIIYSIFLFCAETLPIFNQPQDLINVNLPGVWDSFFICETICVLWFSIEFFFRFLTCPDIVTFFKNLLNIFDLISILPYFLQFLTPDAQEANHKDSTKGHGSTLAVLRVIRLVRVFRIFKLSRYSKGLQILGKTLRASLRELGLLIFFLIIGIILFSSAMYFAEFNEPVRVFPSIPHAFWWGIITMTTIGYGDLVPTGFLGRTVGALCAVGGVLTIALPVPVIVANFNYFYNRESDGFSQQDLDSSRHVDECPFRPTCGTPGTIPTVSTRRKSRKHSKKLSSVVSIRHEGPPHSGGAQGTSIYGTRELGTPTVNKTKIFSFGKDDNRHHHGSPPPV